jgi:hypothetical protein
MEPTIDPARTATSAFRFESFAGLRELNGMAGLVLRWTGKNSQAQG